jgi:hypothetical protein
VEWRVASPPTKHNFEGPPPVRRGPYDYHLDADEGPDLPAALSSGQEEEP